MGFHEEDLGTEESRAICEEWKKQGCQPNYRKNVIPDSQESCGPYSPAELSENKSREKQASHDTISMIAIDSFGNMAAGTSTNGARHKVPGRVGDGPIIGSGSYVDSEVGGCGATGDGDVMMRFLPCYQAVESMRMGMGAQEAAEDTMRRMVRRAGKGVQAGIVVVDKEGNVGGSAAGWTTFSYTWRGGNMDAVEVVSVKPVDDERDEL